MPCRAQERHGCKEDTSAPHRKQTAIANKRFKHELELELIQTHMAQKPLLWVEVGVHAVRNMQVCDVA